MPDIPDQNETIAAAAAAPLSAASDGQSASARPAGDLIAIDQHGSAKRAKRRGLRGVAITRLTTPGPLDDSCADGRGGFNRPGGY